MNKSFIPKVNSPWYYPWYAFRLDVDLSVCVAWQLHTLKIYPKMYFYSPRSKKFFLVASGKCTWLAQNRNKRLLNQI